jgi:pimeloyl-ACP methyl ester carboxylesterase
VFVHGFTGHPEKTWSTSGSVPATAQASSSVEGERPSKFRKVFTSASDSGIAKGGTAKGTVYWPRDLLPKVIPQARVLTYGYDTHIRHVVGRPVSTSTLYAHAGDFLAALESNRRKDPSRPLVFVAHSLGGLIVKEALRQSRGYESQPHLRSVFESTSGLVFFGTPHEGADPLGLVHHVVALLTKGVGFRVNDKIVEALSPSAEYQLQLRDEFTRMIDERGWIIHSFQEQYALPGLFGKKVWYFSASECSNR